ncbi:hypothetical protein Daus18300_012369 [Diaporthe australafricana]|uniref:2EXR domain-containing protein n=1 Tax=Diaporthe australafricana TaxID=127596 RepID=A0ABR3W2Z5_9PEZI
MQSTVPKMETQPPPRQSFRSSLQIRLRNVIEKQTRPAAKAPPQEEEEAEEEVAQAPTPAAAPTQFHRFQDLPCELRLQIWEEATRCKRYVVLNPACNDIAGCLTIMYRSITYGRPDYWSERLPAWTSSTPPPPMLSVNFEAREVALKVWKLSFACNDCPAGVAGPLGPRKDVQDEDEVALLRT